MNSYVHEVDPTVKIKDLCEAFVTYYNMKQNKSNSTKNARQ